MYLYKEDDFWDWTDQEFKMCNQILSPTPSTFDHYETFKFKINIYCMHLVWRATYSHV